jgi:hypothetical protein
MPGYRAFTSTTFGTPAVPLRKGAELHQMQHSAPGVRRAEQGLRCYRAPAGPLAHAQDTPWTWGSWCLVALDGRMWHPDRLRSATG